jgi:RNA-directed DNA polymerase
MDSQEGKTERGSDLVPVSTRLLRIAELARKSPDMVFLTLAHHVDEAFLIEAFARTRKDGAPGVDGVTAGEYEVTLRANLGSLLERFKSGTYKAPPVRRKHIPKGDGTKTRPIGIPTFEDKILQRGVAMLLEAVYEQDFLDCSYGFRPGRSAHQALERLWDGLSAMGGGWVLEVDIKGFFDTLDHQHLRDILDQRVRDGVVRRTINKWLKAGVLEDGSLSFPEAGTPQGGVISPILANLYLHHVLDTWYERDVKPRLEGESFLVRYADDFVIVFATKADADRVYNVLPKRFGKHGLTLHPEKTKLVPFSCPPRTPGGGRPGTFDLLGFTHFWGRSRQGGWVVKRKTAQSRLTRAIRRTYEWCRDNRTLPLAEQAATLAKKLQGHCGYYGITGNSQSLQDFRHWLIRAWFKWLNRRSSRKDRTWEWFNAQLERLKFPAARAVHSKLRHAANP